MNNRQRATSLAQPKEHGAMPPETDTSTDTSTDTGTESDTDEATLGDAGKRAIAAERTARKNAERELAAAREALKAIEDKDKSETDKLREQVAQLTADHDAAVAAALRAEVAAEKGLTAAQAKRLVGATREELEADADELLESFGSKLPPIKTKPKPPTGDGKTADDNQLSGKERAAAALRAMRSN